MKDMGSGGDLGVESQVDNWYHSQDVDLELKQHRLPSCVADRERKKRLRWTGRMDAQRALYANRRRIRGVREKRMQRPRNERVERTVCAQARDRRPAPDLRLRLCQLAQATAGVRLRIQFGTVDTSTERSRDAAQPAGPRCGVHLGPYDRLERLGELPQAHLEVFWARIVDLRSWNPRLHDFDGRSVKEY